MLEHINIGRKREIPSGFNWIAVLKDLAAGAQCSWRDSAKLEALAGSWPTCACGQLCQNLPRKSYGGPPEDPVLFVEGVDFSNRISAQNWRGALETFYLIEARTMELLKEKEKC